MFSLCSFFFSSYSGILVILHIFQPRTVPSKTAMEILFNASIIQKKISFRRQINPGEKYEDCN